MSFEFGQDVVFTELMLYAPMDILKQIAEAQRESILADTQEEDAEIVPVRTGRKLSHKQRRARRRVQNHAHKQSDRFRSGSHV